MSRIEDFPMFDTVVMGSSADRSGADVALPVAVGENHVTVDGVPGTAVTWSPKKKMFIVQAIANSETARMVECWFAKTDDKNRNKLASTHLQSNQLTENILNSFNYPISPEDDIEAKGENAGAVLDILALYMTEDGRQAITTERPTNLPPGARTVRATGTVTAVADSLAEGTIAFDDFVALRNTVYKIYGLAMGGKATLPNEGVFSRLKFLEGKYESVRPGVPCADATVPQMFYGDFGEFRGQTLPNFEHVEISAGAETVEIHMLIVPIGKAAGV